MPDVEQVMSGVEAWGVFATSKAKAIAAVAKVTEYGASELKAKATGLSGAGMGTRYVVRPK